jgi:hypothetical protein
MSRKIRIGRPSPALVVSTLALIVALGGTSYAAFSLPKNSVGSKQLRNRAVTSSKIRNGAVTKKKLNLTGVIVPNAARAASAASTDGFFNSGLVKMTAAAGVPGHEQTLVTRGPFSFIGQCQDQGGGNVFADVLVKDNSATGAIESDYDDNNYSPPTTLNPGETHGLFDSGSSTTAYWGPGSFNDFGVAAPGGPAFFGTGTMGTHVLGSDCVFQLVLFG